MKSGTYTLTVFGIEITIEGIESGFVKSFIDTAIVWLLGIDAIFKKGE